MAYTYNISMFQETFESEFTWLNGFMRNVRRFGYRMAAIDPAGKREWNYTQLNAEANRFANALKKDGVKKSDVIFMQLFNSPEFLFTYIASQKIGAISNPANFNFSPGETAEIISHNKPRVYLYDAEIVNTAVRALKLSKHKPEIVIAVNNSEKEFTVPEGHILYEDYVKGSSEIDPPVDFAPHIYDEIVRLQTSGTTGTGDIGTWDEKQYISIAGRKDDMIISKGENIYPARIEEVINLNPKVSECIVTGVPDSTRGESLAAYVIKADDSLTVAELLDFCAQSPNLSKYQVPRYYRFVTELPHTATGKTQHYLIKKQAREDLKNGLLLRK